MLSNQSESVAAFTQGSGQISQLSLQDPSMVADDSPLDDECIADEPAGIDLFSLFGRDEIPDYLAQIELAKALLHQQELLSAQDILLSLVLKYPSYPEAYALLGDVFVKHKQHAFALTHYCNAVDLAPFDYATHFKCAEQFKELNRYLPTDKQLANDRAATLVDARATREQERIFRSWYHRRLRQRFIELDIACDTGLLEPNPNAIDWQNPALSNGAVLETFKGFQAQSHKKFPLADYYFARAVLKLEDDFIALSEHCMILLGPGEKTREAIEQVSIVIDRFRYSIAYLVRYDLHKSLQDYPAAYQDLTAFLQDADYSEMLRRQAFRPDILNFIENYLPQKNTLSLQSLATKAHGEEITLYYSPNPAAIVSRALADITAKVFQGDVDLVIEFNKQLISKNPLAAAHYSSMAFLQQYRNNPPLASLYFSCAIWLADLGNVSVYYYHRALNFLRQGKIIAGEQDFDRSLATIKQTQPGDFSNEENHTLHDFAISCLQVGREHVAAGRWSIGESCLLLGIARKPLVTAKTSCGGKVAIPAQESTQLTYDLHNEYAAIMEVLGRDYAEIRHYLLLARQRFQPVDEKVSHLLLVKANYYLRKMERQERIAKAPWQPAPLHSVKDKPSKPIITKAPARLLPSKPARNKSGVQQLRFFHAETPTDECALHFAGQLLRTSLPSPEEDKSELIERRKARKKLKLRAKKMLRRRVRAHQRNSSEGSDDVAAENVLAGILIPKNANQGSVIDTLKSLTLSEFEKQIFAELNSLVPIESQANFKTYLGGGWAYDKIRLAVLGKPVSKFNDFDLITEIPPNYLAKMFTPVPEVKGLYIKIVNGIKIDVVHEPVIALQPLARTRDFIALFLDADGKIYDPQGFGIRNLYQQKLYSSLPPAEIFKEDPLRILRAIYTATKRELRIGKMKRQISIDKHLLAPRIYPPLATQRLFDPQRFNTWIGKLFSQQMVMRNYALLLQFGLIDTLFPEVCEPLKQQHVFVKNQLLISNASPFTRIDYIYAIFIAAALAQRVTVTFFNNKLLHYPPLVAEAERLLNASLLFKTAFFDVKKILTLVERPLLDLAVSREPAEPVMALDPHNLAARCLR